MSYLLKTFPKNNMFSNQSTLCYPKKQLLQRKWSKATYICTKFQQKHRKVRCAMCVSPVGPLNTEEFHRPCSYKTETLL